LEEPTPYLQNGEAKLIWLIGHRQLVLAFLRPFKVDNGVCFLDDAADPVKNAVL